MIEQYLASLPGKAEKGEFVPVPMDFVKGKTDNKFQREMQNPKASVFIGASGKLERNQKNILLMSIFDQILDIVYTEKIREDEGGTYVSIHRAASPAIPRTEHANHLRYRSRQDGESQRHNSPQPVDRREWSRMRISKVKSIW